MSELTNARDSKDFRNGLLVTVSVLALLAAVSGSNEAQAEDQDTDRPTIWIELGGQFERLNDSEEAFSPPFMASITNKALLSTLDVQKPPGYGVGGEGKLSFQPENSDWVFSVSGLYGRANAAEHRQHQTPNAGIPLNLLLPPPYKTAFPQYYHIKYGSYYPNVRRKFAEAALTHSESHAILDFQAGKDVGLGMFGKHGTSVVSAGVRYAQFSSRSSVSLKASPDLQYPTAPITGDALSSGKYKLHAFQNAHIHFHDYSAMAANQRSFRGLGPSLSWRASAPFVGNSDRGEIALDWGLNVAVLFGRQKVSGQHQTVVKSYYYNSWAQDNNNGCKGFQDCPKTGHFRNKTNFNAHGGGQNADYTAFPTAQHSHAANFNRMRTVTVPNFGGFAGLSFLYSNAKVSFGYRADMFFGAMDGGIDFAKRENRGFFGPFASISIGFGG